MEKVNATVLANLKTEATTLSQRATELVRDHELASETDLLCDFGIYGDQAVGFQDLDEQSVTGPGSLPSRIVGRAVIEGQLVADTRVVRANLARVGICLYNFRIKIAQLQKQIILLKYPKKGIFKILAKLNFKVKIQEFSVENRFKKYSQLSTKSWF